jgi:hypothetical protein
VTPTILWALLAATGAIVIATSIAVGRFASTCPNHLSQHGGGNVTDMLAGGIAACAVGRPNTAGRRAGRLWRGRRLRAFLRNLSQARGTLIFGRGRVFQRTG